MRYGIQGKLIDFGRQQELAAKVLLTELVEFVDDVVDDLGCRREVEHVFTIFQLGTSAAQQVQIYEQSGHDLTAVADWLRGPTTPTLRLRPRQARHVLETLLDRIVLEQALALEDDLFGVDHPADIVWAPSGRPRSSLWSAPFPPPRG